MKSNQTNETEKMRIENNHIEAAYLAKHAYDPKDQLPEGWEKCTNIKFGIDGTIEKLGLSATLYKKRDAEKYHVAFRGTDNLRNFFIDDGKLAMGGLNAECQQFVKIVIGHLPASLESKVTFCGHSLGASLATFASLETSHPAIVIDSPGIGSQLLKQYSNSPNWKNITAIQASKNLVNMIHQDPIIKRIKLNMPGAEQREFIMDTNPKLTLGFMLAGAFDYHPCRKIIRAMEFKKYFDDFNKELIAEKGKEMANKMLSRLSEQMLKGFESGEGENAFDKDSKYCLNKMSKLGINFKFPEGAYDYSERMVSESKAKYSDLKSEQQKLNNMLQPLGDIFQLSYVLGTQFNKRDLQRIGNLGTKLMQISSAVPAFLGALTTNANPLMLINPALAIFTACTGIAGMLFSNKKNASHENSIYRFLEQMNKHVISGIADVYKHVDDMWIDMKEEFLVLRKEIRALLNFWFTNLENMISNNHKEVKILLGEVNSRIARAEELILSAQRDVYLKDFITALEESKNILKIPSGAMPPTSIGLHEENLYSHIQDEGLLMTQPLLNGADLALTDSQKSVQESVIQVFAKDTSTTLPVKMSYLAHIAARILDEDEKLKDRKNTSIPDATLKLNNNYNNPFLAFNKKIFNPELWVLGVTQYAHLRGKFAHHLSLKHHPIELVMRAGFNFLSFVQCIRDTRLFDILFEKYEENLNEIIGFVKQQLDDQSKLLSARLKSEKPIDICDYDNAVQLYKKECMAIAGIQIGVNLQQLDLDIDRRKYKLGQDYWTSHSDYSVMNKIANLLRKIDSEIILRTYLEQGGGADFKCAVSIDKDNILSASAKVIFDKQTICQIPFSIPTSVEYLKNYIPNLYTSLIKITIPQGSSLKSYLDSSILANYYKEILVKPLEQMKERERIAQDDARRRMYNYTSSIEEFDLKKEQSTLDSAYHDMLGREQAKLIESCFVDEKAEAVKSPEYENICEKSREFIKNKFLYHRKEVTRELIKQLGVDKSNLSNVFNKMHVYMILLINYARVLGIQDKEIQELESLSNKQKLIAQLESYLKEENIKKQMPHSILGDRFKNIKTAILGKIRNSEENFSRGYGQSVFLAMTSLSFVSEKEICEFEAEQDKWLEDANEFVGKCRSLIITIWKNKQIPMLYKKLKTDRQQESHSTCLKDLGTAETFLNMLESHLEKNQIHEFFSQYDELIRICKRIHFNLIVASSGILDGKKYDLLNVDLDVFFDKELIKRLENEFAKINQNEISLTDSSSDLFGQVATVDSFENFVPQFQQRSEESKATPPAAQSQSKFQNTNGSTHSYPHAIFGSKQQESTEYKRSELSRGTAGQKDQNRLGLETGEQKTDSPFVFTNTGDQNAEILTENVSSSRYSNINAFFNQKTTKQQENGKSSPQYRPNLS